jgi:hypothetical protein
MAQHDDDLSIRQMFRVIFMQGGQVAVGTAIGAGVLLLVGIVGVLLAPIWLPIFAIWYWRKEAKLKKAQEAGAVPGDPAVSFEHAEREA